MVQLNSKREVADFVDVSQMEPGESEFACGFFSVSECKFAGEPGKGPKGFPEDVDKWADSQGGAATGGVSIDDMHNLLHAAGLHYWDTDIAPNSQQSHDIAVIKAALEHGYPVVATVAETSVFDLDLNGNPYSPNWTPSGNHVFVFTGIASDGNLLVHDNAAIQGGIFGKVAPQPRHYQASSLENHWASIVQLPWLPPIESGDPLSWKGTTQPPPQAPVTPVVPAGWTYDGNSKTLRANGYEVIKGFCQWILTHSWDPSNVPLENERYAKQLEVSNPPLGDGSQQAFCWTVLEYTQKDNRTFEMWTGQELLALRKELDGQLQQVQSLQQQIAALTGH
ncbi:MAG: hypothetical protein NVSMB27_21380 [Ktedonobacteraceae bacterium]